MDVREWIPPQWHGPPNGVFERQDWVDAHVTDRLVNRWQPDAPGTLRLRLGRLRNNLEAVRDTMAHDSLWLEELKDMLLAKLRRLRDRIRQDAADGRDCSAAIADYQGFAEELRFIEMRDKAIKAEMAAYLAEPDVDPDEPTDLDLVMRDASRRGSTTPSSLTSRRSSNAVDLDTIMGSASSRSSISTPGLSPTEEYALGIRQRSPVAETADKRPRLRLRRSGTPSSPGSSPDQGGPSGTQGIYPRADSPGLGGPSNPPGTSASAGGEPEEDQFIEHLAEVMRSDLAGLRSAMKRRNSIRPEDLRAGLAADNESEEYITGLAKRVNIRLQSAGFTRHRASYWEPYVRQYWPDALQASRRQAGGKLKQKTPKSPLQRPSLKKSKRKTHRTTRKRTGKRKSTHRRR